MKNTCMMDGCDRKMVARELCGKHYQRWAKWGDPTFTKLDRERTVEERFWSKVAIPGKPVGYYPIEIAWQWDACWPWTGGCVADGYGTFWLNGKNVRAHRVAYLWCIGDIPDGSVLDHLCRTRNCCNPAHLEPVTDAVNILRGVSPWAVNAAKTHCPYGHAYNEENTYKHDGERHCRECARRRTREWFERRKMIESGSRDLG